MRIIAGRYRRRQLHTSPGLVTRPITDRVKECLFENIQQRIIGKRIADVFAGTGTIGLEALSRGAERVTFIEKDRKAVELLHQNIEILGCRDETLIWPADVLRCSFRPKGDRAVGFSPFDVIFFDPPYRMVPGIVPEKPLWLALKRLVRGDVSAENASLVIRVPSHTEFDLPTEWSVHWSLALSGMVIHLCEKSSPDASSVRTDFPT